MAYPARSQQSQQHDKNDSEEDTQNVNEVNTGIDSKKVHLVAIMPMLRPVCEPPF
jgi:hypothetical protein